MLLPEVFLGRITYMHSNKQRSIRNVHVRAQSDSDIIISNLTVVHMLLYASRSHRFISN